MKNAPEGTSAVGLDVPSAALSSTLRSVVGKSFFSLNSGYSEHN